MMLLLVMAAYSAEIIEELPSGHIDWTRGVLVVRAVGTPNAASDMKVTEQAAFALLGDHVEELARGVRFDASRKAGDLLDGGEMGTRLDEGLGSWKIVETRYYTSGKVEMTAELDLVGWLGPAIAAEASPQAPPAPAGEVSGVVVDARGLGISPAAVPILRGPAGDALYGPSLLADTVALRALPAVWVGDPADPAVIARAGSSATVLRAAGVSGSSDPVLDAAGAAALQAVAPDVLAEAKVVLVIDALGAAP